MNLFASTDDWSIDYCKTLMEEVYKVNSLSISCNKDLIIGSS